MRECPTLSRFDQSQRRQRKVLKGLSLIPVPASIFLFRGETAAAQQGLRDRCGRKPCHAVCGRGRGRCRREWAWPDRASRRAWPRAWPKVACRHGCRRGRRGGAGYGVNEGLTDEPGPAQQSSEPAAARAHSTSRCSNNAARSRGLPRRASQRAREATAAALARAQGEEIDAQPQQRARRRGEGEDRRQREREGEDEDRAAGDDTRPFGDAATGRDPRQATRRTARRTPRPSSHGRALPRRAPRSG